MKKKLVVLLLIATLCASAGTVIASADDSYSGYLSYINPNYYYLLATDYVTGYPTHARNVCTSHSPNTYNSKWIVRCLCHNQDITFPYWHKAGDYTYPYEDYEHSLTGEKLIARPNSEVTGVTISGTFSGN